VTTIAIDDASVGEMEVPPHAGLAIARARGDGQVTTKMLWVAVTGQTAFVNISIALLAGHVTRMTKAVLRTTELARNTQE
jgi:hypothetical protein